MKLLIKISLLAFAIAFNLKENSVLASDTASSASPPATTNTPCNITSDKLKSSEDQTAYALGSSLGHYMNNSLKEQEKIGIKIDKSQLISGLQDAFVNNSKLSVQEIEATLQSFEAQVKQASHTKMEKEAKDNAAKGDKYRANYAKQKGVKKSARGLLYKINKTGTGNTPTNSDIVVVNYKGTLIDGTEFDNSYKHSNPLSFRLDSVIPGWTEGLKHIKKGGKIQIVIPPEQAYGKTAVPGIPANSTLIFDVELLDIKPALDHQ